MKKGLLVTDSLGDFHLFEADLRGCWHDDDCDGTCAEAGRKIKAFRSTNALMPAIRQAQRLGYHDARNDW